MQMFTADAFRRTRQILSARIRTENVENWAGLWMRVDGPGTGTLAFDNMESRPISGTTDWEEYEVVLDVAQEAVHVALGVLLNGPGAVWIDAVSLSEAAADVPTSATLSAYPAGPTNLDFNA